MFVKGSLRIFLRILHEIVTLFDTMVSYNNHLTLTKKITNRKLVFYY